MDVSWCGIVQLGWWSVGVNVVIVVVVSCGSGQWLSVVCGVGSQW